jgi:hypothetical protein
MCARIKRTEGLPDSGPDWATNRGQHLGVFIARPKGWGGIGRGWEGISKMIQMDDGPVKFTVLCGWQKNGRRDRGRVYVTRMAERWVTRERYHGGVARGSGSPRHG